MNDILAIYRQVTTRRRVIVMSTGHYSPSYIKEPGGRNGM